MKRRRMTKYLTLSLAAIMSLNLAACGSAKTTTKTKSENDETAKNIESAINKVVGNGQTGSADKEETVYVFTDANGNTKHITVSNWLKNVNNDSKLTDETTLTNVKNVAGDEKFKKSGDKLTWTANGNDIYYQGKTTKQPPVNQNITYYLDGQEVTPDKLAGASGHVKIHIDYTNTEKYQNVYVPFTAVTGIALDNDHVKNVKVDHGSVVSEGKNTVVVGMAFPGLQDSLDTVKNDTEKLLDDNNGSQNAKDTIADLDMPSSVEVELDADDFQMSTALTMVFSNLLTQDNSGIDDSKVDKDNDDALSEMDSKVREMTDGSDKLVDGTKQLNDGLKTASDNMPALKSGAKQLADGIQQYTSGVSQVDSGVGTLKNGASQIGSGASTLKTGLDSYTSGVSQVDSGMTSLKNGTQKLASNNNTLNSGAKQLASGASSMAQGTAQFLNYARNVSNGTLASVADDAGNTAKKTLLNSKDYKDKKKAALSQTGDISKKIDEQKAYIKKVYPAAYKTAAGESLNADEQAIYNSEKDNSVFQSIVEGAKSASGDVTRTLQSADAQKDISDAVTANVTKTLGSEDSNKQITEAVSKALSDQTGLQQQIKTNVAAALQKANVQTDINNQVTAAVAEALGKDEIAKTADNAVRTALTQQSGTIEKKVTEAVTSKQSEIKNSVQKAAQDAVNANKDSIDNATKAAAGKILNEDSVNSAVEDSLKNDTGVSEAKKELVTALQEAGIDSDKAAAISKAAEDLSNASIKATGKAVSDKADQAITAAATTSAAKTMEAAQGNERSGITAAVTSAVKDAATTAATTAIDQTGEIATKAALGAVGEKAAKAASTAAAPVAAMVASTTAANTAGETIANVAAKATAPVAANLAANIAAQTAAERAAYLAGAAAANATGASTMQSTLESVESTLNAELDKMDLSSMVDDMSGQIAYQVGSATTKTVFAKLCATDPASTKAGTNVAVQLANGANQLASGTSTLQSGLKTYTDGVSQLNSGATTLKSGTSKLTANNKKLTDGAAALASGGQQLSNGVSTLKAGTSKLVANSGQLSSGAQQLSNGAQQLADGMAQLLSGSVELKDGMIKFNDEAVRKLADLYNDDVKALDSRVKELKDAAKSYNTFTGAENDENSTVKFIYKTDSIEKK